MRGKFRLDGRKNVLNKEGFPIVIYLTKDRKEKLISTGYRALKKDWDNVNALPNKSHPDYINLLNYLEKKKIVLRKVLDDAKHGPMNFHLAEKILTKNSSDIFYEEGIKEKGSRTYGIALNSFNKYFPGYTFDMITKSVAKEYVDILLNTPVRGNKRSPNGVISYMNTLTAIWNKLEKPNNPFSGVRPMPVKTRSKAMTDEDMVKIANNDYVEHKNSTGGGVKNYLNYFMLCFYLGGIDLGDLVKLRRSNIVDGRIEFNRTKGGTNVFVSNKIFPQAQEILDIYTGSDLLIPLDLKYEGFIPNMSRRFGAIKNDLKLSRLPYSKAPRYTFITRAQNLLIDERIVVSLVGHSQNTIHSVYKDEFPYHIRDAAHEKIINLDGSGI
ncbi:hypothetical protein [Flagellimonas flava]|uniref:hypothetical protein n=1 Tax=Flagellimonas flava TaxID=570519 RepID=UPI003D65824A